MNLKIDKTVPIEVFFLAGKPRLVEKPALKNSAAQEQIQNLLFGEQVSWQSIIYDLINTEQLDPWDIDLVVLTNRFLEKIKELEEANFFISSKVLLAAALLLRIKSEVLLHNYIPTLDEILFGKKEEKTYRQERIELEEDIPMLIPRTPLPRSRRVSLEELMQALGKAIKTENRRIKKVILARQQELETSLSLPRTRINLKDQTKEVYAKLRRKFAQDQRRFAFTEIIGQNNNRETRLATFVPLLHLDYQHKVLLEQEAHLEEIWIWLKNHYEETHKEELEKLKKEVEQALSEEDLSPEEQERAEEIENDFKNPIDEAIEEEIDQEE